MLKLQPVIGLCVLLLAAQFVAAQPGTTPKNERQVLISGQTARITCVEFSPDGKQLAFGTDDSLAKIWNLQTNVVRVLQHADGVNDVAFSPDGQQLATACRDNKAYLWSLRGKLLNSFSGHAATLAHLDAIYGHYGVSGVVFSADGKELMTGSQDKTVRFWNPTGQNETLRSASLPWEDGGVRFSDYSSLGEVVFSAFTGTVLLGKSGGTPLLSTSAVSDLRFSPDGSLLATASLREAKMKQADLTQAASMDYVIPGSRGLVRLWNTNREQVAEISVVAPSAVRFSDNNQLLAVGRENGEIGIWSVAGELLFSLVGHQKKIRAVDFSPDGKRLVSASDDGTIKLWEVEQSKLIATLYPANNATGNFIVLLPNDYYFSTLQNLDALTYQIGGKNYPFEQLDWYFNRPDLVLTALGYSDQADVDDYAAAYRKRIEVLGLTADQVQQRLQLPELSLNSGTVPAYTTSSQVQFGVSAASSNSDLVAVHITVNGVPLHGREGKTVSGRTIEVPIQLTLGDGKNLISVQVTNALGAASNREEISVFFDSKKPKPTLYFIGIASGKFEPGNEVHEFNAESDIVRVLQAYKKKQGTTFSKVIAKTIVNESVTKESLGEIETLLAHCDVDDVVMVFFTGHGLLDEKAGNYFLSSYHIDFSNPAENGIPYEMLEAAVERSPSRKRVILLNACKSGEYDNEPEVFAFTQKVFADLRQNSGTFIISSSRSLEPSLTSENAGSVFGTALLNILESHESISVSQLRTLLYNAIKYQQTPTMRQGNNDQDFRVW